MAVMHICALRPIADTEQTFVNDCKLLRVVRCLPLITGLPSASRTLRAGVGQAPREETAGYNQDWSGLAMDYGDLSG
jgi:hypothetical protein